MDFEELYQSYFNDVYRYLRRLSGDHHVAEELTSETFFKAMRAVRQFRGDCDLRVWLCQIAKNSYYTYQKKQGRCVALETAALWKQPAPGASPEEAVLERDMAERLRDQLHTLPEPYREVFMWRVFAELSFRQIGQIFQKSDNWACVTYHRAVTMLKQRWEEKNHEK